MIKYLIVKPAYGRELRSVAEVKAALKEPQDFVVTDMSSPWNTKPGNITDFLNDDVTHLQVRYGKDLTRVTVVDIRKI